MPEIIKWNTGLPYTKHGQRIAAMRLKNGKIGMVDIDRGLSYQYNCVLTRDAVMKAYKNGQYVDMIYGPERDRLAREARTVKDVK